MITEDELTKTKIEFDDKRRSLSNELNKIKPALSKSYENAIQVLNCAHISSRIKFAAYEIRDLMEALATLVPFELGEQQSKDKPSLGRLVTHFEADWKKLGYEELNLEDIEHQKRGLSFLEECKNFFKESAEIKPKRSKKIKRTINHLSRKNSLTNFPLIINEHYIQEWISHSDYFSKIGHYEFEINFDDFTSRLVAFEFFLLKLLQPRPFYDMQEIKKMIQDAERRGPKKEDIGNIFQKLSSPVSYKFFFSEITSPAWLELLKRQGFFNAPYERLVDNVNMPYWAPAKYLIKIAPTKPNEVLTIIKNISDPEDVQVFQDLIDILLLIPSTLIGDKFCKKIAKWLEIGNKYFLPRKISELTIKFLKDNQEDKAIILCNGLFGIFVEENDSFNYSYKVNDEWNYNELIKVIAPHLKSNSAKIKFIKILCEEFKKITKFIWNKNETEFFDYSCVWCESINNLDNPVILDIKKVFVIWIRDLTGSLEEENIDEFNKIIDYLLRVEQPIFKRISINALMNACIHQDNLILSLLKDKKIAQSSDIWYEYALLLKKYYPLFTEDARQDVLTFILNLDFNGKIERRQAFLHQCYSLIEESLPDSLKIELEEMNLKHEKLTQPERLGLSFETSRIGPRSPISVESLKIMTIKEIVEFLNSWKPSLEDVYGAENYGLRLVFEKIFLIRYEEILDNLQLFQLSNSNYVKMIINGLSTVLTGNKTIDWVNVLNYLEWATNHKELKNFELMQEDLAWSEVKRDICWLLIKGFSSNTFHLALREKIWKVIKSILNDPDPREQSEERVEDNDYHHIAINSARSLSLECAIRYGLWLRSFPENEKMLGQQFCEEVFNILEDHLDIEKETSKAVRSIYGCFIPYINHLDPQWFKLNVHKIFPTEKNLILYRNAAWSSYLLYSEVDPICFEILFDQYELAIEDLHKEECFNLNDFYMKLIYHIVIFYFNNKIDINSKFLSSFYEKLNAKEKADMLIFIGRIAGKKNVQQLINFFNSRISCCENNNEWGELTTFGWWFQIDQLPHEWLLDQTIYVLENAKNIEPAHLVIEEMIPLCKNHSQKVFKVLHLIVENMPHSREFVLWRLPAESLITELLSTSPDESIFTICHKLVGYGFQEFGSFLENTSN